MQASRSTAAWATLVALSALMLPTAGPSAAAAGPNRCAVVVDGSAKTVLTVGQLAAALNGQLMTLATAAVNTVPPPASRATGPGSDAPGSAAECDWVGTPIAPQAPYFFDRNIVVNVSVVPYPTSAEARLAFDSQQQQNRNLAGAATIPPVSGVGDAAYLAFPGPQDGIAVLDVLTGRFAFSVSVTAGGAVFVHAPWVPVAAAIVANLIQPAPTATAASADYSVCGKGHDTAAEAAGAQAGGDYVRGYDSGAAYSSNDGLMELSKHNPPSDVHGVDYRAYDVGFFDALTSAHDIQYLVADLGKFHDTVTLTGPPDNLQPLDPLYADGSADPWFWHAFEAALASCRISYQFASTFVGYHDKRDYLIYKDLTAHAEACRGLLVPLPHQEIFDGESADGILTYTLDNAPAADDSYREVAAEALSTDIASLLEASTQQVHFTFPQALALDYTAAQRSGVPAVIQQAVDAYATATLPSVPPSPAAFYYYVPWLTTTESLNYLVAVPYGQAAATATANLDAGLNFEYGLIALIPDVGPFAAAALKTLNGDPQSAAWDAARGAIENVASDKLELGPFGVVIGLIDDGLTSGERLDDPKALAADASALCDAEERLKRFVVNALRPRTAPQPPRVVGNLASLYVHGYLIADPSQLGDLYNALDFVAYLLQRQVNGTGNPSGYQAQVALSNALYTTCDSGLSNIAVDRPFDPHSVVGSKQLSVTTNQSLNISGTGFAAGSQVTLAGHSRDIRLAVVRADATGRFVTVVRPGQLGVGEHEITASGTSPLGAPHQLVWRLRVSAGRSSMPTLTTTRWVVVAGSLLLVGVIVIVSRRHRRAAPRTSQAPSHTEP